MSQSTSAPGRRKEKSVSVNQQQELTLNAKQLFVQYRPTHIQEERQQNVGHMSQNCPQLPTTARDGGNTTKAGMLHGPQNTGNGDEEKTLGKNKALCIPSDKDHGSVEVVVDSKEATQVSRNHDNGPEKAVHDLEETTKGMIEATNDFKENSHNQINTERGDQKRACMSTVGEHDSEALTHCQNQAEHFQGENGNMATMKHSKDVADGPKYATNETTPNQIKDTKEKPVLGIAVISSETDQGEPKYITTHHEIEAFRLIEACYQHVQDLKFKENPSNEIMVFVENRLDVVLTSFNTLLQFNNVPECQAGRHHKDGSAATFSDLIQKGKNECDKLKGLWKEYKIKNECTYYEKERMLKLMEIFMSTLKKLEFCVKVTDDEWENMVLIPLSDENNQDGNKIMKLELKAKEYDEMKVQLNKTKNELNTLTKQHETLVGELQKKLVAVQNELKMVREDKESLQARLSRKLLEGVQKQSAFEDVSQPNRPLALKDKYERICSEEWLYAKDTIDDHMKDLISEGDKCRLLAKLFKIAYEIALDRKRTKLDRISASLLQIPPSAKREKQPEKKKKKVISDISCDTNLLTFLTEFLLNNIDQTDLDELFVDIEEEWISEGCHLKEQGSHTMEDLKVKESLTKWSSGESYPDTARPFIQAVGKLTWSMVLQSVPLSFHDEGEGKPFSPYTQKLTHTSTQAEGAVVNYYVYPAMYQGNMLVLPGTVYVGLRDQMSVGEAHNDTTMTSIQHVPKSKTFDEVPQPHKSTKEPTLAILKGNHKEKKGNCNPQLHDVENTKTKRNPQMGKVKAKPKHKEGRSNVRTDQQNEASRQTQIYEGGENLNTCSMKQAPSRNDKSPPIDRSFQQCQQVKTQTKYESPTPVKVCNQLCISEENREETF